jgi:DNA-binding beta-propeller fold protein YncE
MNAQRSAGRGALCALLLLSGCATVPTRLVGERRAEDPHWARAGGSRVRFVGALTRAEDLGIEKPWWKRVSEFFAGELESSALARPVAVAFSIDGRVAVADPGLRGVRVYEPRSQRHLFVQSPLRAPVGLAFAGERLFVADGELRRVLAFDREGRELALPWTWPTFGRPAGLAWDEGGARLFVADPASHCVHVISAGSATTLGRRGDATASSTRRRTWCGPRDSSSSPTRSTPGCRPSTRR